MGFRFSVQVQKMSKCNCHNMPLFVMWKRTRRRQGRTKVEWEEDSEVSWTNEKLTIPATLFMEEIEGEKKFQSKSIRLSVMKHLRNNKSTEMGYLNMELTDYIHYEEPKMFKIELEGGEFEGAILRCVISARMTGKGEEESDEDEDEDDEEEAAKNIDEDQDEDEDEDDENSQKKKGPVYERPVKEVEPPKPPSAQALAAMAKEQKRRYREDQMCVLCMQTIPEFRCLECKQDLCASCDGGLHGTSMMATHVRKAIPPPVPAEKPSRPKQVQQPRGEGSERDYKSKGMKQKIDALCHFAQVEQPEAKALLEQADWNLDEAIRDRKSVV